MAPKTPRTIRKKTGDSYLYKRKTNRQSWLEVDMVRALKALEQKECGYLKAAHMYNVPKSTLERRFKGKNKIAKGANKTMGSRVTVLPSELESKLRDHILLMEECLFGLTYTDVRRMAYELAVRNGLPNNFKDGIAGYHWLYGFFRRFPELSLRKPENTSIHRSRSFNKTNVEKFYKLYESIMAKHNFPPQLIYNCDEKGVSTVPNAPPKIIGKVGKKQVGTMGSAERGTNTTVLVCGNAVGDFISTLTQIK